MERKALARRFAKGAAAAGAVIAGIYLTSPSKISHDEYMDGSQKIMKSLYRLNPNSPISSEHTTDGRVLLTLNHGWHPYEGLKIPHGGAWIPY